MFIFAILLLLSPQGCESNIQENNVYFPQPWKNWTYQKVVASKGTVRIIVERFLVQKEVELILEPRFDYPRLNLLSPRTYVPTVSICSFILINEDNYTDTYGIIRSKFGPTVENTESSYIIWSIGPDLISNVTVMSRSSLNFYSFKPENQLLGIMHFVCVKLFPRRLNHTVKDALVELLVDGVKAHIVNTYENSSMTQLHLIEAMDQRPYIVIGCLELEDRCGTWQSTLPRISTDVTEKCCQLKECDPPCPAGSACIPDISPPFRTKCQCPISVKGKACHVQQGKSCTKIECENGGTCVSAAKSSRSNPTCLCKAGHFGDRCEKSFLNYRGAIHTSHHEEIPESEHSNITSSGLPYSFIGVVKIHHVNLTTNNSAVHIYLEREYKGFSMLMTWTYHSPPKWKDFFSTELVISTTDPEDFLLTLLPERNLTRKIGRYYVGLVPYTEEVREMLRREKDNRTFDPSHLPEDMDYNITIFVSSCLHQDGKKEGCKVMMATTIDSIACDCQHLSAITGGSRTARSDTELSTVFLGKPVILGSMSVVWLLFSFFLLWMLFLDNIKVKKNPIIYLNHHIQKGEYGYLLMFKTGFRRKAGTTSQVSVKLHGSRYVTDAIPLYATDGEIFQRGDEDWFYFTEKQHVGDIIGLTILIEFKKDKPNWYLSQVKVKDLKTHKYWVFLVKDWFLPEGRCQVEDYFIPMIQGDKSFKKLWKRKAKNELRNRYLFLSFFRFPSRTQFSRAQRLATTFSTYLLSIFITTYWYSRHPEQASNYWTQLLVVTCSTLMALVYEIILIELFLNIKKPEEMLLHGLSKKNKKIRKQSSSMLPSSSSYIEDIVPDPSRPYPKSSNTKSRIFDSREDNFTRTPIQYNPPGLHETLRSKSFCDDLFLPTDMQKPRPMLTAANFTPPRDRRPLETLPVDMGVEEQRGRQCRHLPRWCLPPLWCLVWGVSAVCTAFTLLYGLHLDYEASLDWLLSIVFASVLEVLLCQPLYAMFAVLIISRCFKRHE